MTDAAMTEYRSFGTRLFWIAVGINAIWINASEVFRYFVFVMPMMREAFPQVHDIAPMSWSVFAVWGVWDTVLLLSVTGFSWMYLQRFGGGAKQIFTAASLIWASIFVILWLGLFNMRLATPDILLVALPLAWLEMLVAVYVVATVMKRGYKERPGKTIVV